MDDPKPTGNQEFFDRMSECGWNETARRDFPSELDAPTFGGGKRARAMQLDHFFASRALADCPTRFEVVRGQEFESASDHAPILAEFEIPGGDG
jgi:exonuclease III